MSQRLTHSVLCVAIIAILGWWSWSSDPHADLPQIISNAEKFSGREVIIGDEPVLESVNSDWIIIRSCGFHLRVAATIDPDHVGEFIYVRGTFQPATPDDQWNGVISPAQYRIASGRHAKIWLSVIPVVWIAVLLLRHIRIDTTRWSIELRT